MYSWTQQKVLVELDTSSLHHGERHDWATSLSLFTFMHWKRKWQPIPRTLQCSFLENPRDGRTCWAAVYGVTQNQTWLKWLSSSSSSSSSSLHQWPSGECMLWLSFFSYFIPLVIYSCSLRSLLKYTVCMEVFWVLTPKYGDVGRVGAGFLVAGRGAWLIM